MAVTKEEFDAYVRVQRSGVTNMFNVNRVSELSGLNRPKIVEIMEKYDIYTDKYSKNELSLNFHLVDDIPLTPSGKYRVTISELK